MLCTISWAQTVPVDSMGFIEPPVADSIYEDEDEEYEDYEGQESYDDSVRRAKVNAFDSADHGATVISTRKLPGNFINDLKKDAAFDYVKNGIKPPEIKLTTSRGFTLDEIWIYIALVVFILLLLWYLKENNLLFFRRKPASILSAPSEEIPKDIFSIDYTEAVKDALKNNNYRLAIRLHYLQLLKVLSEKEVINYQPDKTNFEYLLQARPTSYYADFSGLTRQYEYSWYGLFPINRAQYDRIDELFSNLHKKISG